jgi:preprotein translocase subunit SecY
VFNSIANVFRVAELRARLAYTLLLLAVYRLGVFINTPGVDRAAMNAYMQEKAKTGGLVNLFNLFSGGALDQMSIFGLGIMPYVSSSIIMQLLAVVVPSLERLQKEGAGGRQKINQYTRYGTIALSIVQGVGISRWLAALGHQEDTAGTGIQQVVVPNPDIWFTFMTVITLTAGTAFIMWLGERITEGGIGNGISLIIFAGIVARIPPSAVTLYRTVESGDGKLGPAIALVILMVATIAAVVYIERGMRRIGECSQARRPTSR